MKDNWLYHVRTLVFVLCALESVNNKIKCHESLIKLDFVAKLILRHCYKGSHIIFITVLNYYALVIMHLS